MLRVMRLRISQKKKIFVLISLIIFTAAKCVCVSSRHKIRVENPFNIINKIMSFWGTKNSKTPAFSIVVNENISDIICIKTKRRFGSFVSMTNSTYIFRMHIIIFHGWFEVYCNRVDCFISAFLNKCSWLFIFDRIISWMVEFLIGRSLSWRSGCAATNNKNDEDVPHIHTSI